MKIIILSDIIYIISLYFDLQDVILVKLFKNLKNHQGD